jgi:hypothetical protein
MPVSATTISPPSASRGGARPRKQQRTIPGPPGSGGTAPGGVGGGGGGGAGRKREKLYCLCRTPYDETKWVLICHEVRDFEYWQMLEGLHAKFEQYYLCMYFLMFYGYMLWSVTLRQVCPTIFGRGPQPILLIGSWAATVKIISGVCDCLKWKFIHIHSFCSLSYDRFVASSKAGSPQGAI